MCDDGNVCADQPVTPRRFADGLSANTFLRVTFTLPTHGRTHSAEMDVFILQRWQKKDKSKIEVYDNNATLVSNSLAQPDFIHTIQKISLVPLHRCFISGSCANGRRQNWDR